MKIRNKFLAINNFSVNDKSGQPNKRLFSLTLKRIKWLVFYYGRNFSAQSDCWQASDATAYYRPEPGRTDGIPERDQRQWI